MLESQNSNHTALDKLEQLGILRCPECKNSVDVQEEKVKCPHCSGAFPVEDHVPLFSYREISEKGTTTSREKRILHRIKERAPFLASLPRLLRLPNLDKLTRGQDRLEFYLGKYSDDPAAIVLDIGAGAKKYPNVVSLDLYNYPGIELCARADKVPLADNSVDMIISTSAIEHMMNIDRAFQEMQRILKPDGTIFITAPFIYPYHPEPFDLRRWSVRGILDSLPSCVCLESGGLAGPFSTLHVVLSSFFAWLFSFRSYPIYLALNLILNWVFLPLKIVDSIRGRYQKATPLDSIIYFVGKKQHDGKR